MKQPPKTDFLHRSLNLCVCADCGLSAALVYAYLRDWIYYNEKRQVKTAFFENRYWVYRTHEEIFDGLGHVIGKATIPKLTRDLVNKGLLIQGDHNRIRSKRTNWYALGRPADEPPEDVPSAKSHEVIKVITESRLKREAKKEKKRQAQLQTKIKHLTKHRQEYIDALMNADYSDIKPGYSQYGDDFNINDLKKENKLVVISDYVDFCIRNGQTPSFENFTHPKMLDIYACRYSQYFY